ncbi:MAG: hypothetical protein ABJG68_06105 [Crocinitomicaceae bacterium]
MKRLLIFTGLLFLFSGFNVQANSLNAKSLSAKIDVSKAVHKIELGTFSKSVPVKIVELMRELGSVTPVNSDEGSTYYTAPFNSEEEAQQQLPKLQSLGFNSAKHVVEYKNEVYDIRTFHHIANGGKLEDGGKVPVIRLWK